MATNDDKVKLMNMCYGDNNQSYLLTQVLGSGGEGEIYRIKDCDNCVAKIFKKREYQRDAKIRVLKEFQWSDDIRKYVVLPQVILYEDMERTRQCGYVMDKVDCSTLLTDTFVGDHPLSIKMRAIVGINICKALEAIHMNGGNSQAQLLIGDFNFNNIVVNRDTGDIRIIGADCVHLTIKQADGRDAGDICIIDDNGVYLPIRQKDGYEIFPCTVLYPDLFMPEIFKLMKTNPNTNLAQLCSNGYQTFSIYTDYYCMAYHLHLLLLNCTPFDYSIHNPYDGKRTLIMNGNYSYSNLFNPAILSVYCPDFDILTSELKELFIRAFEKGANQPEIRPSPSEFISALSAYIDDLTLCNCSRQEHYVRKGYQSESCEWCRIENIIGKYNKKDNYGEFCWEW